MMSEPAPSESGCDVLYTSDLHGNRTLYEEALGLARKLKARALVLGGDLAPHSEVQAQRDFFADFFIPLIRRYREEPAAAEVYYIFGNDDWRANLPLVTKSGIPGFHYIHGHVRPFLADTWIAGLASVTLTPFALKDWERWEEGLAGRIRLDGFRSEPDGTVRPFDFTGREREEAMGQDLAALEAAITPEVGRLICVFHGPPHATGLDRIHGGTHVGSREIRRFLERRQPLLTLHGHIHESPSVSGQFADQVGSTICVNPGQRMGSSLHAVWFRLDDPKGSLTHSLLGPATLGAPKR
jgi:uncharacterized protein